MLICFYHLNLALEVTYFYIKQVNIQMLLNSLGFDNQYKTILQIVFSNKRVSLVKSLTYLWIWFSKSYFFTEFEQRHVQGGR